jgi:hypothetical protein
MAVFYDKRCIARPYGAVVNIAGQRHNLGYYATRKEAEAACDEARANKNRYRHVWEIPEDVASETRPPKEMTVREAALAQGKTIPFGARNGIK